MHLVSIFLCNLLVVPLPILEGWWRLTGGVALPAATSRPSPSLRRGHPVRKVSTTRKLATTERDEEQTDREDR